MARIALSPTPLVVIEFHEETESAAHMSLPCCDINGLREFADRFGSEVSFGFDVEHIRWIERTRTAAVVDDITPHLQHPEAPDQTLINRPVGKFRQIVYVATERNPTIAGELLSSRLGSRDHRQRRKLNLISAVNGKDRSEEHTSELQSH